MTAARDEKSKRMIVNNPHSIELAGFPEDM
jgi:hypothetical protein